jgi:putative hemolysin
LQELRTVCTLVAAPAVPGLARAQAPLARINPASQHCLAQGGSLVIEGDGNGGAFGVCRFDDHRQCEEGALLRGDCPAGGIRVSGDLTPAARCCVLRGASRQVPSGSNLPT